MGVNLGSKWGEWDWEGSGASFIYVIINVFKKRIWTNNIKLTISK